MLVGDLNGELYYFENTAGASNPAQFGNPTSLFFNIFVGQNAKPAIIDVDQDGLMDIVIGENRGNTIDGDRFALNFYKNIGEIGNPLFAEEPTRKDLYGFWGEDGSRAGVISSAPAYFDASNGRTLMAMGTERGQIYLMDNVIGNLDGPLDTLS